MCQFLTHRLACLGLRLFDLALFWLSQIHTAGLTFVSGSHLNLSSLSLAFGRLILAEDFKEVVEKPFLVLRCSDTLCPVPLPSRKKNLEDFKKSLEGKRIT